MTDSPPLLLVVMGVSGSGKSTVAAEVADRVGLPYLDGDDLHPPANIAKMHAGRPLDDADRWPWLDRVAATMVERGRAGGAVLACSALKRSYRDRLRDGTGDRVRFAFLDVPRGEIERRLAGRAHHFMPARLLQSQFEALERPAADEPDVLSVSGSHTAGETADEIVRHLRPMTSASQPPHRSKR